ncbi:hypothetical protein D3C87_1780490 [compost metagenome]
MRPTATISTVLPLAIRLLMWSRAARMTLVEKPPARPLSAVATTTRCFWSAPVPVIRRGPSSPTPAARLAMTEAIRVA